MDRTKSWKANMVALAALSLIGSAWAGTGVKEKTLYNFVPADGSAWGYTLARDHAGRLYGIQEFGGTNSQGALYEVERDSSGQWHASIVHSFGSFQNASDGVFPESGPIFGNDGNLYGTTGSSNVTGAGVVYQFVHTSSGWQENVLYTFPSGGFPLNELVMDPAGNLYGTTLNNGNGFGEIYELQPTSQGWTQTYIYVFTGKADGGYPSGGLALDASGNLYGVTPSSAFKLAPTQQGGWQLTTLHTFTPDTSDGYKAIGRPVLDSQGNFYGVTTIGGVGWGTAYELSPTTSGEWTEKILYSFTGQTDGTFPMGGLALDAAGNLYGTTYGGGYLACFGGTGCGTVYKLAQNASGNWTETVVHAFSVCSGSGPEGDLISDGLGMYYGATVDAGDQGCTGDGEIFEIKP